MAFCAASACAVAAARRGLITAIPLARPQMKRKRAITTRAQQIKRVERIASEVPILKRNANSALPATPRGLSQLCPVRHGRPGQIKGRHHHI